QIERACQVDVAFRVICAGLFPDHTTIARFRSRHEQALKHLFSVRGPCGSDPDIATALVKRGMKDAESAPLPGRM
ncbi:MAG: transposase, partial [Actinomycetota bacterium]|nr:transposase [Actinomycetota bacterium]